MSNAPAATSEDLFTSIPRAHLWSTAVDQIRDLIESGRLPVGARLPGERELCQQLGISRVSLREAIRVLEHTGYVEVKPGRGTFVRARTAPDRDLLATWLREHGDLIHQLFELRELVEPGLAAMAARRRDSAVAAALAATINELSDAARQGDLLLAVAADAEFHHVLAHATGNSIVDGLMRQLLHVIGEERRASLLVPGQIERAVAGHREILDAVANGDDARAEQAMRRHLRDALRYIDLWLAENTPLAPGPSPGAREKGTGRSDRGAISLR